MSAQFVRVAAIGATLVCALGSLASPASAQTKVRYVEVVHNLAYLPSYVAMGKGYFKDEGLDISLSTAQGGDKVGALMLSGSADIALVGPEVGVYILNSESPEKMKVFCSLTGTSTNFVVSRKKLAAADFKWSMLKGTKFLGWRPGSTPQLFLEYAMRKNGIDPKKDIDLVTNIAVPARLGAWLAGTGEFTIFSEPEATVVEKQAKGSVVTFVGREVGKVDYTVFMATGTFIKKNPKVVQSFTNAVYRAQRFTHSASSEELGKIVQPYFPGITAQQIAGVVDRYRAEALWPADPVVYEKAISDLQDILVQGGVLKPEKRVKYSDAVVTNFAEEAKAKIK